MSIIYSNYIARCLLSEACVLCAAVMLNISHCLKYIKCTTSIDNIQNKLVVMNETLARILRGVCYNCWLSTPRSGGMGCAIYVFMSVCLRVHVQVYACAWVCEYAHLVPAMYGDPTSLRAENCTYILHYWDDHLTNVINAMVLLSNYDQVRLCPVIMGRH
jgi:hypothetical protein